MEKKQVNINKCIGITLVYFYIENNVVEGVLKSLIIETTLSDFEEDIQLKAEELAEFYNLSYAGINDVFVVSGNFEEDEIFGRTTDYDISDFSSFKKDSIELNETSFTSELNYYSCVIYYRCLNNKLEELLIEVIVLLNLDKFNFVQKIELLKGEKLKDKLNNMSLDNLMNIEYIGIKEINEISPLDANNHVFETLYSDFINTDELKKNVITNKELKVLLKDVFKQ